MDVLYPKRDMSKNTSKKEMKVEESYTSSFSKHM